MDAPALFCDQLRRVLVIMFLWKVGVFVVSDTCRVHSWLMHSGLRCTGLDDVFEEDAIVLRISLLSGAFTKRCMDEQALHNHNEYL